MLAQSHLGCRVPNSQTSNLRYELDSKTVIARKDCIVMGNLVRHCLGLKRYKVLVISVANSPCPTAQVLRTSFTPNSKDEQWPLLTQPSISMLRPRRSSTPLPTSIPTQNGSQIQDLSKAPLKSPRHQSS